MKKTNRFVIKSIIITLVIVQVISLCSCGEFLDDIVSQLAELDTLETTNYQETIINDETKQVETEKRENVIPFYETPSLIAYTLPNETFSNSLEEEASKIIDGAICKAISCVNAMKDDRHSKTSYSYDEDANGFLSELDSETRTMYYKIREKARNVENFSIKESEYNVDLKESYFSLFDPIHYCDPFIGAYCSIDSKAYLTDDYKTHYKEINQVYFDPYKDENVSVSSGQVTIDKVKHDAELLDCIVKRIIRFMPENLSAYDKYYYLAVVVCEKTNYDDRTKNCSTCFGALVSGKAVCEGYSTAYTLLCKEAGLYCAYRMSKSHMWNMIKLDSGVYNVDLTWADEYEQNTYSWYRYFIKTDETFVNNGHEPIKGVIGTGTTVSNPYEN